MGEEAREQPACIPGIKASVVSCLQQWQRFLLIQHPTLPVWRAEAHGSEYGDGDPQTALAQLLVLGFGGF